MPKTEPYIRESRATELPHALISPLNKGLGLLEHALSPDEIRALNWNLLREDLSLPTAVLYEGHVTNNLDWMQQFASAYGMKLAPHGKTTMAPKLFSRQLAAGAWGITVATVSQTRVAYEHGVRRVLMANQLIGRQNMAMIARLLDDAEFEYFCLVDSAQNVALLGEFFKSERKHLNVLLEVGPEGGRTGVRNHKQLQALLDSLSSWREHLVLCGVEVYEGVLQDEHSIRQLLQNTADILQDIAAKDRFDFRPVILTGAGSAWYDIVAEIFAKARIDQPLEIVLRPGCYVTHDVGNYRTAQREIEKRNPVAQNMSSSLQPALQLWAYVHSLPETGRAIIGFGKRDAAFDAGLPTPALHYRPGNATPTDTPTNWNVTRMMDQHAFMDIADGDDLRVGDMVAFDISHPCLTFDKWRYLPVLDDEYRVIDIVQTFF